MTDELKRCPFCAAELGRIEGDAASNPVLFHPGTVGDGTCLLAGRGITPKERELWNHPNPRLSSDLEGDRFALLACSFARPVENRASKVKRYGYTSDGYTPMWKIVCAIILPFAILGGIIWGIIT